MLSGKRKLILLVIALLVVVGIIFSMKKSSHNKSDSNQNNIESDVVLLNKSEVYTVLKESIEDTLNITGDLSAKEQTIISAEVDAKVLKVLISEGQSVKKGDVLAMLDAGDLSQDVLQQQAQVAAAQSQLELNKQKMNTQQALLKQGFISQISYDELVANYKSALQNYNAQLAMLKRSQNQLSNTKIVAPFDGVVYQKSIDAGQFVQKNTKLFSIANINQLEIKSAVPSDKISAIELNESVVFKVEDNSAIYNGHVARINPVSEPGTRSYMVYIDVDNPNGALKPGQFVQGSIVLSKLLEQNVVDCDAIFVKDNTYAMMINSSNIVNKQNVKVLLKNKSTDKCALGGINVGAKLIANSVLTVKDGDKVSLMNY
ncbi:MAG: efflux RND transporter periplasmic adaptor subunit [Neisseriaceae bacterium]|jgi:RND family efflux transporter MFP subunit|nr:MAG: efflux RND transporter periplasmic adaptor subunit [Neisseriaceae bacterium]